MKGKIGKLSVTPLPAHMESKEIERKRNEGEISKFKKDLRTFFLKIIYVKCMHTLKKLPHMR